jgi:hypothetical protein
VLKLKKAKDMIIQSKPQKKKLKTINSTNTLMEESGEDEEEGGESAHH